MGDTKRLHVPSTVRSGALITTVLVLGAGLAAWKHEDRQDAAVAAASQPEPMEVVSTASAWSMEYQGSATAVGTVVAMQSVSLRNELAGTVREVRLTPGVVVDAGTLLVALDVSVEEAELKAQQARAALAESNLERLERLVGRQAISAMELDNARAARDVALAEVERTKAVIARKTIRAPFRARVGLADVHPGQFLDAGTFLTTLQSVDAEAHIDFTVSQSVAMGLRPGQVVDVLDANDGAATGAQARIVAIDARVDQATRSTLVRARIQAAAGVFAPGASVIVRVPVGETMRAVAVPVSALRKGPAGDHVFVVTTDEEGAARAFVRPVQSGTVVGNAVVILDGLDSGEQVASTGSFKLREGVRVVVADAQAVHAGGEG